MDRTLFAIGLLIFSLGFMNSFVFYDGTIYLTTILTGVGFLLLSLKDINKEAIKMEDKK